MKVLFVATVRSHIGHFHMPFIRRLKELGNTVDAAYKDNSDEKPGLDTSGIDTVYEVDFSRSPYSPRNLKAYRQLKRIIAEGDYDAVHCHTPMGSVVTRLAAKGFRKNGLKVIYTAHGFHFFKGAPRKNWLFFYNVEKALSKYTDCLITINEEDCELAKSDFSAKALYKVNGVGVDLSEFRPLTDEERAKLRAEYGYKNDEFILIYPANLTAEKNHSMLFEAVKILKDAGVPVRLLCPGQTEILEILQQQTEALGISDNVDFLGFRRDIPLLDALSDVSVSASAREGLPVNLIEALAVANPIVATDVRGNRDVVRHGENGYLVDYGDSGKMAEYLLTLYRDEATLQTFKDASLRFAEDYSVKRVNEQLLSIYKDLKLL